MNSLIGQEHVYDHISEKLNISLKLSEVPVFEATAYHLYHMRMFDKDFKLTENEFRLNSISPQLVKALQSKALNAIEKEKEKAIELLWETNGVTESTSLDVLIGLEQRYRPFQKRDDLNLNLNKKYLAASFLLGCAQGEWIYSTDYKEVHETFFTKDRLDFDATQVFQEERNQIIKSRNTPSKSLQEIFGDLHPKIIDVLLEHHKRGNFCHHKNMIKAWTKATMGTGSRGKTISYRGQWLEPNWKKRQSKLIAIIGTELHNMFPDDVEPPKYF